MLLQGAQQLGLDRLGQVGDLVEQQRATLGSTEVARAGPLGAGKRALAITEQLGLGQ